METTKSKVNQNYCIDKYNTVQHYEQPPNSYDEKVFENQVGGKPLKPSSQGFYPCQVSSIIHSYNNDIIV